MPAVTGVEETVLLGVLFTAVRMEGILHLVYTGPALEKDRAEDLLKRIAEGLPDEAAGLLQWNRETGFLRPLVYVRKSNSLVWENGCGSGSAAVGAAEALRAGAERLTTAVRQPGGVIRAEACTGGGKVRSVTITGLVRLGEEKRIRIP